MSNGMLDSTQERIGVEGFIKNATTPAFIARTAASPTRFAISLPEQKPARQHRPDRGTRARRGERVRVGL
jgi:hypothetical protein